MIQIIILISVGFISGSIGAVIGAGGGFILVPILLIMYPDKSPEAITSISLGVVLFNALSGTTAYWKMKRIDVRSGLQFAAAALPGTALGAAAVEYIPRNIFGMVFGLLLVTLSAYLISKPKEHSRDSYEMKQNYTIRKITTGDFVESIYGFNKSIGIFASAAIGFISSILGIGGGIVQVPVMVKLLHFPIHIASATSLFILIIMSFTGSVVHYLNGSLAPGIFQILYISVGAVIGAQAGALFSKKLNGSFIIRLLGLALGIVGLYQLYLYL